MAELVAERELTNPIVLALPRGGVPVASVVAMRLGAPLDVFVARKLGAPGHRELGIGAIAECGGRVVNHDLVERLGVTAEQLAAIEAEETSELERRAHAYRDGRPLPPLADRDVVIVDDGLATGVTGQAALAGVRTLAPRRLILAAPVAGEESFDRLRVVADDVVCVVVSSMFGAVGSWYDRFGQTTDEEVRALLSPSEQR